MGRIVPDKDQISIVTTIEEMLHVPIISHVKQTDGMQVNSNSLYDVFRCVAWRMLWLHGQKFLEGMEASFAYGDIDITEDGKVTATFYKKRFIPKEPGGP